jgi:hypothetical protein
MTGYNAEYGYLSSGSETLGISVEKVGNNLVDKIALNIIKINIMSLSTNI